MKDFMFRFLAWLVTLPLILGTVAFAIFHTQGITLTFSPWHNPVTVPLYMPVLSAIGIGFFFGALMTWAANGRLRAKSREQKKKIAALEQQIAASNENAYKRHNYGAAPVALLEKIR